MARVTFTSREAYHEHVISGKATSGNERILRYLLKIGREVTRHEVVDRYFWVGYPPKALDGGDPIPWQTAGARIAGLICKDVGCNHSTCDGYIMVVREGPCPVTGNKSEFIAPIGTKWAERRMF